MRFNKQELTTLASQPSYKYEKEGVLFLKENNEGFFRRYESVNERWFRLSGNLLFYLKTKDHWSEPVGVIVLENHTVTQQPASLSSKSDKHHGFQFTIGYQTGGVFTLSAATEEDRASWIEKISTGSFTYVRTKLNFLKSEVQRLNSLKSSRNFCEAPIKTSGYVQDVSESPICEIVLSCDNLKCDSFGRAPNPKVIVYVRNNPDASWTKYGSTEVIQRNSNPTFLTTVSFRGSDGITEDTEVKLNVVDVRERMTSTITTIGHLCLILGTLKSVDRFRLPLTSYNEIKCPSFITIHTWNLEKEERSSTESTPSRCHPLTTQRPIVHFHRRTQSLPTRLGCKLKMPQQENLSVLFNNVYMTTYRFHSGLGGDIFTHELMAEPKLVTTFPQQLLKMWICEEKELVQEIVGLGELRKPWHSVQTEILQRHLSLMNLYTHARHNLATHKDFHFKQSSAKGDKTLEFLPLNLHLQRIWAHNESLHKSGFHDTFTVGAFTAFAQGYDKSNRMKVEANSRKVEMTYEWVQSIKRLRKEIVERMQIIMLLAKERRTVGIYKYVEEIYYRCRLLLSICDQSVIAEALEFFESQKLSLPQSLESNFESFDEFTRDRENGGTTSCQLPVDEGIETPNSPLRSLVDVFKKDNCRGQGEDRTPDSGVGIDDIVKSFLDSPSSNYYRPCEEPEPWELTQVNIEASVISLSSKVKVLCGHTDNEVNPSDSSSLITRKNSMHIPGGGLLLRGDWRKSLREEGNCKLSIPPPPPPSQKSNNNVSICADWSEELRASVKKLRLAMDGLLKTSRLAHSIFRLQQDSQKCHMKKYRQDVCFSQALTSVVAALMSSLWCSKIDPCFVTVIGSLGPIITFHSFLTAHAAEAEMLNDLVIAINQLKTVTFTLSPIQNCTTPKVLGSRWAVKVILPVPQTVYALLPGKYFCITPVIFNIGVNEHATVFGNSEFQHNVNLSNFTVLNEYCRKFNKLTLPLKFPTARGQGAEPNLTILLDKMHKELLSNKKKNLQVIHFSAEICRVLLGLRFTSCKSGKDRTSMAVTLEQVQILNQEYDLAETEFQSALDAMRSEGCRRENTLKNIGQRKYAFNSAQVMALPKPYRPPPGTYGNVQT